MVALHSRVLRSTLGTGPQGINRNVKQREAMMIIRFNVIGVEDEALLYRQKGDCYSADPAWLRR